MHWYCGYGPGAGGLVFVVASLVLLIVGAVAVVALALRGRRDPAKRILEERLARGEIDAEEYERVRKTLSAS
ncbi:SHOCT domain-containing protein [Actinosynnema sp. NPDC059335]|uniref:SHOCT domain-containing protein n=1 Tax=Actinosynnema sp. NPDC059335 TaxID=3346804 RepID=UPI0036715E71